MSWLFEVEVGGLYLALGYGARRDVPKESKYTEESHALHVSGYIRIASIVKYLDYLKREFRWLTASEAIQLGFAAYFLEINNYTECADAIFKSIPLSVLDEMLDMSRVDEIAKSFVKLDSAELQAVTGKLIEYLQKTEDVFFTQTILTRFENRDSKLYSLFIDERKLLMEHGFLRTAYGLGQQQESPQFHPPKERCSTRNTLSEVRVSVDFLEERGYVKACKEIMLWHNKREKEFDDEEKDKRIRAKKWADKKKASTTVTNSLGQAFQQAYDEARPGHGEFTTR